MDTNQADKDLEMVRKAAEDLGEHFDTVQVLATRHEPGDDEDSGTVNVSYGVGNWFARYGQGSEWLKKCDERTRQMVRNQEDEE
jgi:hypothetical protein